MIPDAKRLSELVPTSWLDSLLSGPEKVISSGPCTNTDIERLLLAVKKRLQQAEAEAAALPAPSG